MEPSSIREGLEAGPRVDLEDDDMLVNDAVIERRMKQAVSDYIAHHRNDAIKELQFYRDTPTLGQAITRAAQARTARGGKHPHQWRIPLDSLREFGIRLSGSKRDIRKATSFDELHEIVREVGESIYMIGELTIYDTAHRIGSKLRLPPTRVYAQWRTEWCRSSWNPPEPQIHIRQGAA